MPAKDPRYLSLVRILDGIRAEAPQTEEFKRYYSKKRDDVTFTRSQSFIHLYLLTKFGIQDFVERQKYVCDGPGDGGLDAYYIAESQKTVYLLQAKFRTSEGSFQAETIGASELVRMELGRIINGETTDSNGVNYNARVHEFQLLLSQATRRQIYKYTVVFLANLKQYNDFQVRKLTENLDYEVYDFDRCYLDLVKPVCSGTYFDPKRIVIELDLLDKNAPQLSQTVSTSYGDCEITVIFVPTVEIGRVMSEYRNAILRYNPRNYLGLSKNPVNKEIRRSISGHVKNDFALLNNGITILADLQEISVQTGSKNVGRLILTNPQIINGGQTAYTLSDIYEKEYQRNPEVFSGKEVLVRVVVLKSDGKDPHQSRFEFIDSVSTSTNQQTLVKPADRHSSDPRLVSLQTDIFRKYGYFLELKQGEFFTGRERGYVRKEYVIDRITLLRALVAFGGRPTPARRHSERQLYDSKFFESIFVKQSEADLEQYASEAFFAYKVHSALQAVDRTEGRRSLKYGYALRYGKYAVVSACALLMDNGFRTNLQHRSVDEIEQYVDYVANSVFAKWKDFEEWIQALPDNKTYFDAAEDLQDFDSYYKGTTLKDDLVKFFGPFALISAVPTEDQSSA